jgi:hypothetical protein
MSTTSDTYIFEKLSGPRTTKGLCRVQEEPSHLCGYSQQCSTLLLTDTVGLAKHRDDTEAERDSTLDQLAHRTSDDFQRSCLGQVKHKDEIEDVQADIMELARVGRAKVLMSALYARGTHAMRVVGPCGISDVSAAGEASYLLSFSISFHQMMAFSPSGRSLASTRPSTGSASVCSLPTSALESNSNACFGVKPRETRDRIR